jgi:MarR family transcriptional regulator, organic hydroperoxide resistance regulator
MPSPPPMTAQAADPTNVPAAAAAPPEGLDALRLDLQLCFALYASSNLMTRLYRPLLEPLGLTYPQYLAMMALWEASPQGMTALGRRLRLDSGTLTPLCKRLEKAGLVRRLRDLEDERRVLIELTEAGRALRARAAEVPMAALRRMPLPLEEAAKLKDMLTRLAEGLEAAEASEGRQTG